TGGRANYDVRRRYEDTAIGWVGDLNSRIKRRNAMTHGTTLIEVRVVHRDLEAERSRARLREANLHNFGYGLPRQQRRIQIDDVRSKAEAIVRRIRHQDYVRQRNRRHSNILDIERIRVAVDLSGQRRERLVGDVDAALGQVNAMRHRAALDEVGRVRADTEA